MAWDLRHYKQGALLHIKVQTKARENRLSADLEGIIRIKVMARPVKGAANEACIKMLARFFKIPKSRIILLRGLHSKEKWLWFKLIHPSDLIEILDLKL